MKSGKGIFLIIALVFMLTVLAKNAAAISSTTGSRLWGLFGFFIPVGFALLGAYFWSRRKQISKCYVTLTDKPPRR